MAIMDNILKFFEEMGRLVIWVIRVLWHGLTPPYYPMEMVKLVARWGPALIPTFITVGVVFAIALSAIIFPILANLGLPYVIVSFVVAVMGGELGVILAGGIGGAQAVPAVAAEIATMKQADEIDALSVMGIDPIKYIAFPIVIMLPIILASLTILVNFLMLWSVILSGAIIYKLNIGILMSNVKVLFDPAEFIMSIYRAALIGLVAGFVCSYYGLNSEPTTEGIGSAAKNAIVRGYLQGLALVAIFDLLIYKF